MNTDNPSWQSILQDLNDLRLSQENVHVFGSALRTILEDGHLADDEDVDIYCPNLAAENNIQSANGRRYRFADYITFYCRPDYSANLLASDMRGNLTARLGQSVEACLSDVQLRILRPVGNNIPIDVLEKMDAYN